MKNQKLRKALLLVVSALLLMSLTVVGTLAYLQSTTETVQNTFTVGNVSIDDDPTTPELDGGLTEADVDLYGNLLKDGEKVDKIEDADRVIANEYKLMPGHTYVKDPTLIVAKNSEEAYIRMIVTISDLEHVKTVLGVDGESGYFLPQNFVKGWDSTKWITKGVKENSDNTATYEFWYYQTVNTLDGNPKTLEPLFTHIVVPEGIDNDGLTADVKDEDGNVVQANFIDLADLKEMKIDVVAHAIQADGFDSAEEAWNSWN